MSTVTYAFQSLIACAQCGQLHNYTPIAVGKTAQCSRCNSILYRNRPYMVESTLALTLAGLVLFLPTNFLPLLSLKSQTIEQQIHLVGASLAFWQQEYYALALLIVINIMLLPLFELVTLLIIMLTLRYRWQPNTAFFLFRWLRELKPWGMLEVFMLGILVAVVKLGDLATLIIDAAFWSFAGLVVTMAAATATVDPFSVWQQLQQLAENE